MNTASPPADLILSRVQVATISESSRGPMPAYAGSDWLPNLKTVDGVRIIDPLNRVSYVVTIADHGSRPPTLTSLWRAPFGGDHVGITWLDDSELAWLATAFLRRRAAWYAGLDESDRRLADAGAYDFESVEDEARRGRARPSDDVIASEARLAMQAGRSAYSPFMARPYGVSRATAERWVAAARDAPGNLLPELTGKRGRPRKNTTKGSEQ